MFTPDRCGERPGGPGFLSSVGDTHGRGQPERPCLDGMSFPGNDAIPHAGAQGGRFPPDVLTDPRRRGKVAGRFGGGGGDGDEQRG